MTTATESKRRTKQLRIIIRKSISLKNLVANMAAKTFVMSYSASTMGNAVAVAVLKCSPKAIVGAQPCLLETTVQGPLNQFMKWSKLYVMKP